MWNTFCNTTYPTTKSNLSGMSVSFTKVLVMDKDVTQLTLATCSTGHNVVVHEGIRDYCTGSIKCFILAKQIFVDLI